MTIQQALEETAGELHPDAGSAAATDAACVARLLSTEAEAPLATYRIQFNKDFPFTAARQIVPYLRQLGISDLYASPISEARPGSQHGYDVVRHDRLNPELGGESEFALLSEAMRQHNLELLLDIVPNHMGIGNGSEWWQDVLENGHSSKYAEYFDIDWTPLKEDMQGKLLLPVLGNQYGEELEAGNIQIKFEHGRGYAEYYEHRMPLAPRSLPLLFASGTPGYDLATPEFRELLVELESVAPHWSTDTRFQEQRREQLRVLRPRLTAMLQSAEMQPAIAAAVKAVNGVKGDPHSYDQLHKVLEAQPYRLALWRTSSEQINYRRFFDVNTLAGLRMENPAVFAATHSLVRRLMATGQISGVRIDHCDGMFNPREYLIELQMLYVASQCHGPVAEGRLAENGVETSVEHALRGFDWASSPGPCYAVVEKILEPRESMPKEWPVRGTSGYDFTYFANQVFIQKSSEPQFTLLYDRLLGKPANPEMLVYECKHRVMQTALASEVFVLTNLLSRIAAANRRARDYTDTILETTIREAIACFPVYRTYIDERGQYSDRDRTYIRYAIAKAKRLNPEISATAFDFLRETLLLSAKPAGEAESDGEREATYQRQLYFALKFQQLTGPVMAKGVEDTAFYAYTRFISSNEVGGTIQSFGISADTFHGSNEDRLANSPDALLTTATHDTKRGEDVRARLNVLSEMPGVWSAAVNRWRRGNEKFKRRLEDGRIAPDANEEYLLYQTLVGSWPWHFDHSEEPGAGRAEYVERIQQYMSKAMSEAKVNLSWINPDQAYTEAVQGFVGDLLNRNAKGRESRFVEQMMELTPVVSFFGAINSLAQTVLKVASPGVPDFYQGSELWELSLVDPDNRRPVNYGLRQQMIAELETKATSGDRVALCRELLSDVSDGRVKLWTILRALETRTRLAGVFRRGSYVPITVERDKQEHCIAFLRGGGSGTVITAVPRFAYSLMKGKAAMPLGEAWGNAELKLPEGAPLRYENAFTGEIIEANERGALEMRQVFAEFPVSMLIAKQ